MTDLRKAAQMALDWRDKNGELLFALGGWDFIFEINNWSQSLRGALAQPEPEPVAWIGFNERGECREVFTRDMKKLWPNYSTQDMTPVYAAPPQREWERLTDEEKLTIVRETDNPVDALAATEAKLKEKNT